MADFPIAEFAAWVRTKPAGEEYNFCDARSCAVAQFGIETGRKELVGVSSLSHAGYEELELLVNAGFYNPRTGKEWDFEEKFGALAERIEAFYPNLPAKPVSDTWTRADAYLTDIEAVDA
jgi:hypothetical protein